MDHEDERLNIGLTLGEEILVAMHKIADAAHDSISYGGQGFSSSALIRPSNLMVGDAKPERYMASNAAREREALRRLTLEPFVARVEIEWRQGESTKTETFYLARGSACGFLRAIPNANFIPSLSGLGAIAEYDVGEVAEISLKSGDRTGRILKKSVLTPQLREAMWDAVIGMFDVEGIGSLLELVRSESLRQGMASINIRLEGAVAPDDVLGRLVQEIAAAEAERAVTRRRVMKRISLRDQAILDQFQGDIFRLPVDRQVALFGPPGSGKTTTLIKRLAQKRTLDALPDEERLAIERYSLERFMDPHSWAMFSPSDLLKEYLGRAFAKEGVPDDRNVRTWDKERLYFARDVLNILRSGNSGRFQLETANSILTGEDSAALMRLHDRLSRYVADEIGERCKEALEGLLASGDDAIRRQVSVLTASFAGDRPSFADILGLIDDAEPLRREIARIDERADAATDRVLNAILRTHPAVFREAIDRLSQLKAEEEEDAGDDDGDEEITQGFGADPRAEALELLRSAIRDQARAIEFNRRVVGRSARVLELIGPRMPDRAEFGDLGRDIAIRSRIRALVRAPRSAVLGVPGMYSRFRRRAVRDELSLYRTGEETRDFVGRNLISSHETDVVLLLMLQNARRLVQQARERGSDAIERNEWLSRIEERYLTQVFVDEATDLSAIQLACTVELTDPRLRSWFASGDFRQRITAHGISNRSELEWLNRTTGIRVDLRNINVGYRQSRPLRELANAFALLIDPSRADDIRPAKGEDDSDIAPLLAEGLREIDLARWLSQRITEIEVAVGTLPSIAIFVDAPAVVTSLTAAVRELLKPHNISVMGYTDGLAVGDEREVRIFDIRHVKGMEFEAVFFVGVDEMAARHPDLFQRFVYVGITRAATYLGLTCGSQLPPFLAPIRDHFSTGTWDSRSKAEQPN